MDLISSPVLALKLSKEDFDPDQCKSQAYGIGNKVVYIKLALLRFIYIYSRNRLYLENAGTTLRRTNNEAEMTIDQL